MRRVQPTIRALPMSITEPIVAFAVAGRVSAARRCIRPAPLDRHQIATSSRKSGNSQTHEFALTHIVFGS
jgi:hypothetical protein